MTQYNNKTKQIIWDAVTRPIGIVQISGNIQENLGDYECIARFLNDNRYIVFAIQCKDSDFLNTDASHIANQINRLKQKYNLPLFLIENQYAAIITHKTTMHVQPYDAIVCLADIAGQNKFRLKIALITAWLGKILIGKNIAPQFLHKWHIIKHANITQPTYYNCYWLIKNLINLHDNQNYETPRMIISDGRDIKKLNLRLARELYAQYNKYDLQKLVLLIYPDIPVNFYQNINWKILQTDMLDFFNHWAYTYHRDCNAASEITHDNSIKLI